MANAYAQNQIRIIGGEWRHRRLDFDPATQIRPTADRVRETLFNWLMHDIAGACCLDLFAGSGALGFEALSRGAEKMVMCDKDPRVTRKLTAHAQRLGADGAEINRAEFPKQMPDLSAYRFDGVFLDPPFDQFEISQVFVWLLKSVTLEETAWIYCEWPRGGDAPDFPSSWRRCRELTTRHVQAGLYRQA